MPSTRPRKRQLDCNDVINMQYTSGTTGFPKGVMLTHHNILNNGFYIGENQNFTDEDRVCIPVPLFHCFGCVLGVMACVTHGATMVILENFDPVNVLLTVEKERCTGAVRRADHVHRRAGAPAVPASSTSPPCAPASWPAPPARSRP